MASLSKASPSLLPPLTCITEHPLPAGIVLSAQGTATNKHRRGPCCHGALLSRTELEIHQIVRKPDCHNAAQEGHRNQEGLEARDLGKCQGEQSLGWALRDE